MIDKKIILCDMDETILDLISELLPSYNETYGCDLKKEDILDYDITKYIHSKCLNIFKEFCTKEIIRNAKPIDGSVEVISKLNENHEIEVYICTAAFPETLGWRDEWLEKYFKFYNSDRLIRCKDKQMLNADVLVDDYIDNLLGERFYKSIIFTQPWNIHISKRRNRIYRIDEWNDDAYNLIKSIL